MWQPALQPGEVVLDLGSGGGFDCFLAADQVGAEGQVIGVDMTPDMISKARSNAVKREAANVDFRLGEIERLPVADNSVDVILSNCVINLSPDKAAVFRDSFRVLKSGGRLAISDIVATSDVPEEVQKDLAAVAACVGGAAPVELLKSILTEAGFVDIKIEIKPGSRDFIRNWMPGSGFEKFVASAYIKATKPEASASLKATQSDSPCC